MRMWYSGFSFPWQYLTVLLFLLWEGMNSQEQTETVPEFNIKVPAEVTVQRGLCVLIPCNFTVGPDYTLTKDAIGIWYKGYNGHPSGPPSGPVAASTDSSQFPDTTNGRFIFTGKVSAGDCSFSIRDAQPGDTDQYLFRLEGAIKFNYLHIQPSVSVMDLKEPDISPTKNLIAGEEVTVTCTAPTNCPGLSPTFTWEGSVNTENTQRHGLWHQDGSASYWSTITFTPLMKHHNSTLTCNLTYKNESVKTSVILNVEYPKETCLNLKVISAMVAGNILILILMGLGNLWYLRRTKKMQEKGDMGIQNAGETREDPKPKAEESTYETLKIKNQDIYSSASVSTISRTH